MDTNLTGGRSGRKIGLGICWRRRKTEEKKEGCGIKKK